MAPKAAKPGLTPGLAQSKKKSFRPSPVRKKKKNQKHFARARMTLQKRKF